MQWSFGITCWEVYSLGRLPYPGIDNADILDYVQKGNVLRKPFLCPQEMYVSLVILFTSLWRFVKYEHNLDPCCNDAFILYLHC